MSGTTKAVAGGAGGAGGAASAKMERVRAALSGERPDRIPYSIWTHFPGPDMDAARLAETTMGFYREFDLDFIKNMPNGLFSIEDHDCGCDFSAIPSGGVARATRLAVNDPDDWERLRDLDIEAGAHGRELRSLELLLSGMRGEAPVIATLFSPLTTAQKLSGPHLAEHLKTHPKKVKAGLEIIAASTARFAARVVDMGCAGLYFASQMSQKSAATEAEYREFGVPYDLKVFGAVKDGAWFNVMHIHGDDVYFDLLASYPVQGISWHAWETAPSVADFAARAPGKAIVGGLRRYKITEGALDEISRDVRESVRLTGGKRLFLAPGCVIRAPFDRRTLEHVRNAVAGTAADAARPSI